MSVLGPSSAKTALGVADSSGVLQLSSNTTHALEIEGPGPNCFVLLSGAKSKRQFEKSAALFDSIRSDQKLMVILVDKVDMIRTMVLEWDLCEYGGFELILATHFGITSTG